MTTFRKIFLLLALTSVMPVWGQKSVEKIQQQKAEIERQIKASESLLSSTDKDIKTQLSNLNILSERLSERRRLLDRTGREIRELTAQSDQLAKQLDLLRKEYDECRDRYAEACRFYQRQKTSLNPLMFLFSSSSYRQLSRRFRYVREYSKSISDLASEISVRQDTIVARQSVIDLLKNEKLVLQAEQSEQEEIAKQEEQKQRSLVTGLQSKRTTLKKEIDRQQKEINALGKEIDRLIAAEMKKQKDKSKQQNAAEQKQQTENDFKLTGSFESNKGKLPVPVSGQYLIIGNYGTQQVAGMKDVKINNLGIDIQCVKGSEVKVIFDGTVTTVFQQALGQIGVLVRHGSYISVYCNLSDTKVSSGSVLKTGDVIGHVASDPSGRSILHFQLHRENTKLNPSEWLKR